MSVTTTFRDEPLTLLLTTAGEGWVADVWDSPSGQSLVVTAAAWVPVFGTGDGVRHPFIALGSARGWGYAVSAQPDLDPVARFTEMVRQERERSMDRLSAPLVWEQVWP